jgi:hypothetical protein
MTTDQFDQLLLDYITRTDADAQFDEKVDKVTGKQLSRESFSAEEKTKLAKVVTSEDNSVTNIISLTQEEYDALGSNIDGHTVYLIKDTTIEEPTVIDVENGLNDTPVDTIVSRFIIRQPWGSRVVNASYAYQNVLYIPYTKTIAAICSSATAAGQIMTSTNLSTWTSRTGRAEATDLGTGKAAVRSGSAYGFIIPYGGTVNRFIYTSNFTSFSLVSATIPGMYGCAIHPTGNGIIVGNDIIYRSTSTSYNSWTTVTVDGSTWSSVSGLFTDVCWSNKLSKLYAISSSYGAESLDGITWSKVEFSDDSDDMTTGEWRRIIYAEDMELFVAVSNINSTSGIAISVDGITWKRIDTGFSLQFHDIAYSPELHTFVATISGGQCPGGFAYSNNGVNWKINPSASYGITTLYGIEWVPDFGMFVAATGMSPSNPGIVVSPAYVEISQ